MIKTILFDVDGVLLSEEHYFDASALTVWEMLISKNYLGLMPDQFKTNYSETEIAAIRENVFNNDTVLELQKSRGLNANWDMIYLTFCYQLIHLLSQVKESESKQIEQWLGKEINRKALLEIAAVLSKYTVTLNFGLFNEDFQKSAETKQGLMDHLNVLAYEKLGIETTVFSGKGALWSECEHASQEWYVGDEHIVASTGRPSVQLGKKGFLANEATTCPSQEMGKLFQYLINMGISIGIGTGRPELETVQPFIHLDWLKYFDGNHIVTADDVLKAENEVPKGMSLSKPNPFTYVMALLGKQHTSSECIQTKLPLEKGNEVLIVGDSLADLLAAREMGCLFAAVLTGLSGQDARSEFEENGAEYILDTVVEVKDLVDSFKD
ncbi:HAD family hydrolase [Bacillus sp. EB600]|uniref:HAD family hydrolase n=1 Tax=Bacillus sp. EB600 TaxID=2806345 RepID=UPI00210B7A6D|nr:HAD family hydrolase [Bacillus sp. EB600]MCQ6278846.1 HAD hydrolase-like protein [Bacillus sp. EB600]